MASELTFEEIGPLRLCISKEHRFGTDAFLLADFAQVRRGDRACDLCSGCGIIPILWLRREERRPAVVYGVELLEQAAKQMDITCRENGLEKIFIPLCRDLRELEKEDIPPASLDVVACTLPDIAKTAARLLKFGGRLCLCGRPQFLPDTMEALRQEGLEPKRLRFVQKLGDKPPWLFLLEGRKGGKPFLQVEAPLLMERPEGGFSPEVLALYGK